MTRALGPTGRLVERFLERLARLGIDDFGAVVRTWRDTLRHNDAWYAAEDAVGEAVARTRRDDPMWLVQDDVYGIFRGAPWYGRQPVVDRAPSEFAAQYLAQTAAVALLVADTLSADHLRTLFAPFADVIPLATLALDRTLSVEPEVRGAPRTAEHDARGDDRARH
jgi:hypothetical protein